MKVFTKNSRTSIAHLPSGRCPRVLGHHPQLQRCSQRVAGRMPGPPPDGVVGGQLKGWCHVNPNHVKPATLWEALLLRHAPHTKQHHAPEFTSIQETKNAGWCNCSIRNSGCCASSKRVLRFCVWFQTFSPNGIQPCKASLHRSGLPLLLRDSFLPDIYRDAW